MTDPNVLQSKLERLCDAYAVQLPEKLKHIEEMWEQLSQNSWDGEGFQILYRMVHSLTGSGKTFGFVLLSDAARNLEEYLKQVIQIKTALSEEQYQHIQKLMRELRQVAIYRETLFNDQAGSIAIAPPNYDARSPRHIFLLEDDPEQAEELKVQLGYFGYEVTVFYTLADFRVAMQRTADAVILTDISFPDNSLGGVEVIKEIQAGRDTPFPVIFITVHDEFVIRLEAARAGGIAYLSKPINIGKLIDKLDALTSTLTTVPYRVMIIDDSESLAAYYATVLEQAGMVPMVVHNPLNLIKVLLEFAPDLILIDLYMPEYNGMDLAKVIRQLDAFVSIPIVFLSAEIDLDKQLVAMSLGGDDFLAKPIQPQHLISSVNSRIQRSLILRSLVLRDSLTGLFNHTAIKDELDREVVRSKRHGIPLAFAMIDIDHFKQINDAYGHPIGDRIIKSLARLLKQRLRASDLVGRYGGEEFAVVLVNVDRTAALQVLDTIRKNFSNLRYLADGKEFSVTFSCGIADISQFRDVTKLIEASDKALYNAKHAGRNQVVVSDAPTAEAVGFI
ncbi:MAG: response regulator receiver modulated diguanylate cyclase [Candidatus Nitrotoga sp. SPKER]|nr:MAG: response regulator receiver modulated diguanylate cyclase [Candidatus Nitrotoga sp. SPKER]